VLFYNPQKALPEQGRVDHGPGRMQQNDTVQLLISCESQARLEACLALFRDAGHNARAQRVTSLRDLGELLRDPQWDLFVADERHPEFSPADALAVLAECAPDLPCLVRAADPQSADSLAWLRAGAREVLAEDDHERLLRSAGREITARREHRELAALRVQYAEIAERAELLLAASRDAIAYVVDGMHVHVNELYAQLFGYGDVGELESVPLVDLIAAKKQKDFKAALKRYRANPEAQTTIDFTGERADGGQFAGQLVLSTASFEGEPCMQVLVRPAATAPASAEGEAPASRGGLAALTTALAEAVGGQLVLIAVDGFGQQCRNLGITGANRLVDELGTFVAQSVGWKEELLRVGDSILALRLATSDPEQALADARRAVEAVATHIHTAGAQSVTCSICIEVCPLDTGMDASVEALIDRCWGALLATVERAHGLRGTDPARAELTRATLVPSTSASVMSSPSIEEALRSGTVRVLFQPMVSLRGDSSEYYEVQALHEPSGKPALDWLAESYPGSSSEELDQLVAQHALKQLATHSATHPATRVMLPLGAGSLLDPHFANWLAVTLRASEIPPDHVTLAIAHRTVGANLREAKELAEKVTGLGCQLCITEVHSANNPIPDLLHIRPQFARIAESLAVMLGDTESTNTLLKPLIESLHREQIASIMPCVEGAGVLAVLWQLGINFIQGNYLQAPLPRMQYEFTDLA
jgi:multidomain signaling protein FimX